MGAKWLFQLRSAPGQQTSTLHLFDRFEALGAKKLCKWKTQTSQYKRTNPAAGGDRVAQDVFLVQFPTDVPDKCFMVAKHGDEDKVMEAASGLHAIWAMINPTGGNAAPLYTQAWTMTVEGWTYDLGDLVMRVGSVVIRNVAQPRGDDRGGRHDTFKGAVMEVEYLPCADRSESMQLVNEFVEVYCQPDGPTAVPVSGFRPATSVVATRGVGPCGGGPQSLHWQGRTKEYTNEHRAQQYVALFHAVMKSS